MSTRALSHDLIDGRSFIDPLNSLLAKEKSAFC